MQARLCRPPVRNDYAFPARDTPDISEAMPRRKEAEPNRFFENERGKAKPYRTAERQSRINRFQILTPLLSLVLCLLTTFGSLAQTTRRRGAHSTAREAFTPADRKLVERAVGTTCAERARDPLGSAPIDEMQTRPSLSVTNPNAVAGARRAERLLPQARELVARAILKLSKDYGIYGSAAGSLSTHRAMARVQAVKRIKPDVDARDNAAVLLREPHTIEFGTIFLAGLRSDEGMISVLGHELTHVADGQNDSLRPLFRAIARRASARTGLLITGQRAEELGCDLVGLMAAREFIKENASWDPLARRLARAIGHNCVDDDASDEDHLSPRSTIKALFALDLNFAGEIVGVENTRTSLSNSDHQFGLLTLLPLPSQDLR
jgi:hypothetical protein